MNNKKNVILIALLIAGVYFGAPYVANHPEEFLPNSSHTHVVTRPATPVISETIIPHKSYSGIIEQLNAWGKVAPQLCDVGYLEGKTSRGQQIVYIRLTNKLKTGNKDKVLAHFCIHGNEPLSTSVGMSYIANLLHDYNKVDEVTDLLDNNEIYFIPSASPDTFAQSRYVDGVDPNRDFQSGNQVSHNPTPTVKALQDFFQKHKFKAVLSGHTYGRIVMYSWGCKNERCKDDAKFLEVIKPIAELNNYRIMRGCEMYSMPIHGSEIDYYYSHGAFATVWEYGTHQHTPSVQDTTEEFNRTWKGFKYFVKHARLN